MRWGGGNGVENLAAGGLPAHQVVPGSFPEQSNSGRAPLAATGLWDAVTRICRGREACEPLLRPLEADGRPRPPQRAGSSSRSLRISRPVRSTSSRRLGTRSATGNARGTESLRTPRWRELDSNLRFRARAVSVLPVRDRMLASSSLQRRVGRTSNPAFAVHDRPYVRGRLPWFRPEDHVHMPEGLRKAGWEGTWFDAYSGRAANRWLLVMRSGWDLCLPAVVPELLKAADPQARRVPSCHSRPPGRAGRRYRRNCAGRA
jgi:hypothetical protein